MNIFIKSERTGTRDFEFDGRAGGIGSAARADVRGGARDSNMAQVMARHLHKRRRLSQLLARLVVTLHSAGGVAPVAGEMDAGAAGVVDAGPAIGHENELGPAAAIDAVDAARELIEVGAADVFDAAGAVAVDVTGSLNNNFYFPLRAPQWVRPPPPADDAPLDLSLKPEPERPAAAVVSPSPVPAIDVPSTFPCDTCGETFEVRDRLAKHISCRHRTRGGARAGGAVRAFVCVVCGRRFARSDMLTRHARLHSGVKPYACGVCGQVFSRSDHLATHQRTHTGEKPYRCPSCPYAACRRDMITRHMRTHARRPHPA